MPDDVKKDEMKRLVIEVLAGYLADLKSIPNALQEKIDSQGDLSSNDLAAAVAYHRTMAEEFNIFDPDGKKDERINKAESFATRLIIESIAAHRGGRLEALAGLIGSPGQKSPMTLENLAGMIVKPPEGMEQPEKKGKRFGII